MKFIITAKVSKDFTKFLVSQKFAKQLTIQVFWIL